MFSFKCNFFAYFKFHTDWGRVIGKIKQDELDYRDTAPLKKGAFHFTGCGSVFNNTLKSPDYPNDYPSNMHCVYKIAIPGGMALKITYQDFLLEYPNIFTGKW